MIAESAGVMRRVPGTEIAVHPFAVDGSVFGWASGVEETALILDSMVEYGGNLVSTADHYAGGRSEIMIGSWLARTGSRSKVVLSTKIGRHPDALGLATRTVVRATDASLRRLETDYIDFLALDGVDESTPIDETLEAVDMLRRAGKVRWLAVRGYSAEKIREINELAAPAVYPEIRAVSAEYSLMHRTEVETELMPTAEALGVGILARLPLAGGYLLGDDLSLSDDVTAPLFADAQAHNGRRGNRVVQALESIAEQTGEPIGRIALAWVLSKPGVVAAAIRVKGAEQLAALTAAGELVLTRQQVSALDRTSD